MAASATYVDLRMREWGIGESSGRVHALVRKVLSELPATALFLKDGRLEVQIASEADYSVWAYFPIHKNRLIARKLTPKAGTRVLLVLSAAGFDEDSSSVLEDYLRDHFGHVLLYLRDPKASNECPDAENEWNSWAATR